jgi:hypothetical protein
MFWVLSSSRKSSISRWLETLTMTYGGNPINEISSLNSLKSEDGTFSLLAESNGSLIQS